MERYSSARHRMFPAYEYKNAEDAVKGTQKLLGELASRLRKHRDPELRALAARCDAQVAYLMLMEREKLDSELMVYSLFAGGTGTVFVSEKEEPHQIGEFVSIPPQDSEDST